LTKVKRIIKIAVAIFDLCFSKTSDVKNPPLKWRACWGSWAHKICVCFLANLS